MCHHCDCDSDYECDCENDVCECGGHGGHHFERRYQTKAEKIAELEAYLEELKAEVQAVEEHLADLHR